MAASEEDVRRRIAGTDVLLADPRSVVAVARAGRIRVKDAIVTAQQRARQGEITPEEVLETALAQVAEPVSELRPVINATGVLVHTNLGRAPLSAAAREALLAAAGCTDVEFDLLTGQRARRGTGALTALASAVPDAEAVHVVNNNAAALLLCGLALGAGREIVVSRGELVEIGDGFRIPELLASTGARLREVGATNRTHLADYADAIGPDTAFVLKVHPSNFQVTGFTSEVGVAELAGLGVPVVADIGSGLLVPEPLLPEEPDATSMLRAGAALVSASGDKLLGGPQAGLLLGRAALIHRLRRHPSARALRVDKLTLAALEATLRGPEPPVGLALHRTEAKLTELATVLAGGLAERGIDVRVVPSVAVVGGGGAPGVRLASTALSLPERFAAALRAGTVPVIGRVEHGRCLLDLRTVAAHEHEALVAAVSAADRAGQVAR